ncbi:MAG: serine/threonine-protein kinase [Archangium sp.]|nr:serine/threonine-protein kinase [Archangium sp.]
MHLGQVIGKFRLDRRLGHGAMGDVYLGVHVELGSFVAIKILNAAACAEPNGIARFLNEAKAVAEIDHEQIARVIDQDRLPDGTPYIVMEFVEGVTLRELLDERGALGLRLTVELLLDVLSALQVAHARGIVHRDLKPENIRVTPSGRAKILDFGIAKRVQESPTPLTQQGMLIGTPFYMSPEQIDGQALDGRSDLYAVGVILFECVTGKRPFEGSTVMALLNRHLHEAPVSPRMIRAEITLALESVILRALEKPPVLRFGTADEFAAALRKLFDELPVDGPVVRRIRQPHDIATPSVKMEQGTTEDAFEQTVRSPRTRQWQRPMPFLVLAFLVIAVGWFVRPFLSSEVEAVRVVDAGFRAELVSAPVLPSAAEEPPPVDAGSAPSNPPQRPKKKDRSTGLAVTGVAPPSPSVSGVTMIETGSDRKSLPIDFDPRAFDAIAYITRAAALARANMPDAVLTNFNVSGLFTGDLVDLTLSREFHADYYFRSPARSVVDPRLREEDQDIPCLHYVVVTAKKIESYTAESFRSCKEKPLPRIKCSIGAAVRQAPNPGKAMNVAWLHDGWFLDFGEEGSASVECP